jgi:hypothetical protein
MSLVDEEYALNEQMFNGRKKNIILDGVYDVLLLAYDDRKR